MLRLSSTAEMRLFEFYARRIWPFHRLTAGTSIAKRCQRCILSERASPLKGGVCEECRNTPAAHYTQPNSNAAELDALFTEAAGSGQRCDALVLFSGGKDSTYLLQQLKLRYPALRLMTLFVDNGFSSPAALSNISHVLQRLPVDHLTYRPNVRLFRKMFRYALLHLGDRNCYDVVDRLDGDLIHDIARNIAASMRIPLLISGVSREQVRRIFEINAFEMPAAIEAQVREQSAGIALADVFNADEICSWWDPRRYPESARARVIFPFFTWAPEEQAIRKTVQAQGLLAPGSDSLLVTNNALIPVMGALDIARLGYSSFEPEFARMVREGKSSREMWLNIFELLEYCGRTGFLIKPQIVQTLRQLNLTTKEIRLLF